MSRIHLLWDESHIWGLLAWRALEAFGVPYRVVRSKAIAEAAPSGKSGELAGEKPGALIVPGGVARRKAQSLGPQGMQAIREYVGEGGNYIGFCGGAGLGLTGRWGLGLCPWSRQPMADRMLHLVSGHVQVDKAEGHPLVPGNLPGKPSIPVWWPARFAAEPSEAHQRQVDILATYGRPSHDFWVADIALHNVPDETLDDWQTLYGIKLGPAYMSGQPGVVSGDYWKGRYVLSYAHLETPESPEANRWLAHIIKEAAGCDVVREDVPVWTLLNPPDGAVKWDDPVLAKAAEIVDDVVRLGTDHFLLFERNGWLLGWRAGIPGANINNIVSLLRTAMSLEPGDDARSYLRDRAPAFLDALRAFHRRCTGYLLAERLSMTLSKAFPEAVPADSLKQQREALFGPPMEGGGLYMEILSVLDELVWRLFRNNQKDD